MKIPQPNEQIEDAIINDRKNRKQRNRKNKAVQTQNLASQLENLET